MGRDAASGQGCCKLCHCMLLQVYLGMGFQADGSGVSDPKAFLSRCAAGPQCLPYAGCTGWCRPQDHVLARGGLAPLGGR